MLKQRLYGVLIIAIMCLLIVTPSAAQATTTLLVWDAFVRDVESSVIETLTAEFEAAHPGVDVVREPKAYDDIRATIGRALSEASGPDVTSVNQGRTDMQPLVEAGLLVDLSPYAEQYGWFDVIPPGIVARNSFSPDGVQFGTGNLYGVPVAAEFVGVFYNKDIFAANGIGVPATFAEFEEALAVLSAAGVTPIAFGSLDGWPAIHTYSELQNQYVTGEYLDDFIYGRNAVSFNAPENVAAAAKLQEWVEKGYFTPQFEGIGYDDSWRLFADGQAAMILTGSWISGELASSENAAQFSFFILPGPSADAPKPTVGGSSVAYSIRQGSPNADLGAEYIDWMLSERAAELWIEAGVVPLRAVDREALEAGTLFTDIVTAWGMMNETDTVAHYLDWASPTMYGTITASLQELLALRVTPEEFAAAIEVDYAAFLQTLLTP